MTPMLRAADGIVLGVLGLLCVGVVMVNSAGLTLDTTQSVTFRSILWSRPTFYMALAMAFLLLVSMVPLRQFANLPPERHRWVLGLVPLLFAVVLLAYAPVIGHEVNGSSRWIVIPGLGLTMQPSELAKWGVLLVLAWYCATQGAGMAQFTRGLVPGLLLVGPLAALIALEDLGTGVLIAGAACIIFIAAGARVWHLAALAPIGLAALGVAILMSPYRVRRLTAFLDPYADPDGAGYHMIQSLVAVSNGEVFGRGLGFGLQKFGYLPEDRTDFLFAVICEELGVAGAVLVLSLIATVTWCGLSIVARQRAPMLKLLGLGVVSTFSLQALINLSVVTGLAPTKGIALPLLSSGGTGWILTAGSLGLLVAMDRSLRQAESLQADDGHTLTGDAIAAPIAA